MRSQLPTALFITAICHAPFSVRGAVEGTGAVAGEPLAEAIYDAEPSHLWNRLHHAFFVRPDAGSLGGSADTVDPPLWPDTAGFLKSGATHRAAVAVLDEFLAGPGPDVIRDPLKRAVLQHDLWSVFDWSATCKSDGSQADRNLVELRSRLAAAIRQLALTDAEIAALPDNLAVAVEAGAFGTDYDSEHPRKPFLPTDLFDADGPWVCVRGGFPGPSAPVHVEYYRGRSPFLVFVRLPGGRAATLRYLTDLNRKTTQQVKHDAAGLPQFPVGTMVALARQMAVIDTAGKIRATPLTQTLQIRVYRQVGHEVSDHEDSQAAVKFRLRRSGLFCGHRGGLEPISWEEPLRVSLLNRDDLYDREPHKGGVRTVMASCIACHSCGGATVHSVFTYKQDDWVPGAHLIAPNRLRLTAVDPVVEADKTAAWKMARFEWGLLKGLLDRP